jgi:hypothetical protein
VEVRYEHLKKKILDLMRNKDDNSIMILEKIKSVFNELMYKKTLDLDNKDIKEIKIQSPRGLISIDQLSSGEKSIFLL